MKQSDLATCVSKQMAHFKFQKKSRLTWGIPFKMELVAVLVTMYVWRMPSNVSLATLRRHVTRSAAFSL